MSNPIPHGDPSDIRSVQVSPYLEPNGRAVLIDGVLVCGIATAFRAHMGDEVEVLCLPSVEDLISGPIPMMTDPPKYEMEYQQMWDPMPIITSPAFLHSSKPV